MMKRAQTATEYLILLSVAILIVIIAVKISGNSSNLQSDGSDIALLLEYATKTPLAITYWSVGDSYTTITIKNTGSARLQLDQFQIAEVNNSFNLTLGSDAEQNIVIPGDYSISVTNFKIGYTDLRTDAQYSLLSDTLITTETSGLLQGLIGYWRFDGNYDDSANNETHGTPLNNTTLITESYITLDGSGDYVDLGSIATNNPLQLSSGEFTISLWAKVSGEGDDYQRLIDKSTNVSGTDGYALWFRPDENAIGFQVDGNQFIQNSVIIDDTWTNIVITSNTTTNLLYIDGVEKDATYAIGSYTTPSSVSANMKFGDWQHSPGDREYNGSLNEIMIFNRTLSVDEISDLYIAGLAIIS